MTNEYPPVRVPTGRKGGRGPLADTDEVTREQLHSGLVRVATVGWDACFKNPEGDKARFQDIQVEEHEGVVRFIGRWAVVVAGRQIDSFEVAAEIGETERPPELHVQIAADDGDGEFTFVVEHAEQATPWRP